MDSDRIECLVDEWVARELAAAPVLRPRSQALDLLARRRRRGGARRIAWWASVAAMAAGVLMLLSLEPPSRLQEEFVSVRTGQREGAAKRGGAKGGPEKGERGAQPALRCSQLFVKHVRTGEKRIRAHSLTRARVPPLVLGPGGDYCLELVATARAWLYVFQVDASGAISRLYPRPEIHGGMNPIGPQRLFRFPEAGRWYRLAEGHGKQRLYVVVAAKERADWDELFASYATASDDALRERLAAQLRRELVALALRPTRGERAYQLTIQQP